MRLMLSARRPGSVRGRARRPTRARRLSRAAAGNPVPSEEEMMKMLEANPQMKAQMEAMEKARRR